MSKQTRRAERRNFLKQSTFVAVGAQALLSGCTAEESTPGAVAETQYGRLSGSTQNGVHRFLGVRYGGDTSGENRFQSPTKPESWTGIRDATNWGKVAPQALATGGIDYTISTQWMNRSGGQGEDCLALNVWTPGLADGGKRAVLFSIHGGGYSSGTGSNPAFDGQLLAERDDMVVVTINHRLGSLGFLHLGELVPEWSDSAVAGMQDIVAALEWVRDNIENFGGDPGNVMICGQSGGGGKVSHLMAMPSAKGLFHRAAIQSGATLQSGNPSDAALVAERTLAQIGLPKDRARELQSVPWEMMMGAQMRVGGRLAPIVDGNTVPRHPFDPDAPATSADVPLLIGTCLHDSAYRLPSLDMDEAALGVAAAEMFGRDATQIVRAYREAYPDTPASLLAAQMGSDQRLRGNGITMAERKQAQGGAPVYMYRFDWSSQSYGGKFGAVHGVDVPLSFGNTAAWPMTGTGAEAQKMSDQMSAAWVAFAKTGDPNADALPEWPAYDAESRATMILNVESRVENDPDGDLLKLVGARS